MRSCFVMTSLQGALAPRLTSPRVPLHTEKSTNTTERVRLSEMRVRRIMKILWIVPIVPILVVDGSAKRRAILPIWQTAQSQQCKDHTRKKRSDRWGQKITSPTANHLYAAKVAADGAAPEVRLGVAEPVPGSHTLGHDDHVDVAHQSSYGLLHAVAQVFVDDRGEVTGDGRAGGLTGPGLARFRVHTGVRLKLTQYRMVRERVMRRILFVPLFSSTRQMDPENGLDSGSRRDYGGSTR